MSYDWETMRIIHKQREEEAHREAKKERRRRIALFNLELPFLRNKTPRNS